MKTERHIVLVNPQIPVNTGALGRTALGTDSTLHLVKPLGFSIDSKYVKRAGLDYWYKVDLKVWESFDELIHSLKIKEDELYLFSRFATKNFWNTTWSKRSFLIFGSETKGLPSIITKKSPTRLFSIPTTSKIRSLNLSTAAGIVLFESLRETDWIGCQESGNIL